MYLLSKIVKTKFPENASHTCLYYDIFQYTVYFSNISKSLGPIDRKFHGHGENDEFVLYKYIIKLCKYISVMGKKVIK